MSTIPARVAAEAAQAMQDLASLAAVATPPPSEPVPAPAPPTPPAPVEPPPTPAPVATVQPVPNTDIMLRQLQQQLNTMQGRLEATTAENAVLKDRIERLPTAPAPAPTPPPSLITDTERKEYGEEFLDVVARVFRQEIGTRLDDIGNRVAGLEGRLGRTVQQVQSVQQVTQQSAAEKYLARLDKDISGWEQVNEDPKFLDWLQGTDILTKRKYHDLLADAHSQADADRVIHIFRLYKPDLGTGSPAPPAPPAPAPAATTTVDPNSLAAPATTAPTPPPSNPPAGPMWTQDMVDQLYEDKQKGRITPADFAAREKDYFKALAEGRVVVTQ